MGATDKFKKTIDDLDLQKIADQVSEGAGKAAHETAKAAQHAATAVGDLAHQAAERTGQAAYDNREKVDDVVGKVGDTVNSVTKGKITEHVEKAKAQVSKGVDYLESLRPEPHVPHEAPPAAELPASEPSGE